MLLPPFRSLITVTFSTPTDDSAQDPYLVAMLAKLNRSAVVPVLRHRKPSPWANTELSQITIAECFAGSGSLQIGSAQQPRLARPAPRVRVRHRSILCLVLLRAPPRLQSDRRRSLPYVPGITKSG